MDVALVVTVRGLLFCLSASRSIATRAAFRMACFGNPALTASSMAAGSTSPVGDRIADQIAFARACQASGDKTIFGRGCCATVVVAVVLKLVAVASVAMVADGEAVAVTIVEEDLALERPMAEVVVV